MPPRLHRRGRIWYASFYSDGERVRQSTHCTDRRAAESVARRLERDGADPSRLSTQTTVEGACKRLLADRASRGRSSATLRYYRQKGGQLVRVLGASTPLERLTPEDVEEYIRQRLSLDDPPASRHTVAKELGALRAMLRIERLDPYRVLPMGWAPEYKPRTRSLTRAEVAALLRALPSHRRPIVAFIVATGARWGEVERHRPEDWHGSAVALRGTKTALSSRVVPIMPHVAALAQRARRGEPWARWPNVRRDLAAACKRAKIERCSPNDLRRTASGWLVQAGAPSNLVGQFMGHADGRMVERVYGRLTPKQLGSALATVTHLGQRHAAKGGGGRKRKTRKS